jgi:hypothetical protein
MRQTAAVSSTDDEHEMSPNSGPEWLRYERDVRDLVDTIDGSRVTHNVKSEGIISGTTRQIDVLVDGTVVGSPIRIVIECKHYAKPLGIGKIDEFAGKLADLHADRGIIYGLNGVTAAARARADGAYPAIEIRELTVAAPPPRPWPEYVSDAFKLGDCENPNCIGGDVSWQNWPQADGSSLKAGACWVCGTWSVECECGEATNFVTDEETCVACGRVVELVQNHDGSDIVDVIRTKGPVP